MDLARHKPKMQLEDWLDDLCVRFIINLPPEDLSSVSRICFQVEEAQWFYEDFIRPLDPTLPSMSLRSFCLRIFQHCPLLSSFSVENHMRAFEEFIQYKTRIPVRGAILLNEAMDSTVLVKGWKKAASWSFPRGKINKDEDDLDCAIREVDEETGFDIKAAGLVPEMSEVKYIEISIRQNQVRLYVFRNIPMDTVFEPKTRKEISKVAWYRLSQLPAFRKKGGHAQDESSLPSNGKFYMVAPFLVPLKKWVVQQKKKDSLRNPTHMHLTSHPAIDETFTEDDMGTQTEAPMEPQRTTPAIDTFEGANRELQRLLKVQPPTSGVQLSVPHSSAQSQDRGGALLAMLQTDAGSKQDAALPSHPIHQQQDFPPHIPPDHTDFNPLEPQTPHHHHPTRRMPLSSHTPPPNFPVPPHQANPQMGMPHQYQQQSLPAPYPGYPIPVGPLGFQGPAGLHGPPAQPGVHPSHPSHPEYRQSIPLGHPQPVPPPIQNVLFNPGGVPTGADANAAAGVSHPGMNTQSTRMPGMPDTMPQPPTENTAPLAQLNNHKMALLNAFRAPNGKDAQPKAPRDAQSTRIPLQAQSQPSAWLDSGPSLQPHATAGPSVGNMSHHLQAQVPRPQLPLMGVANPAPSLEPNNLLDMFKQQGLASMKGQHTQSMNKYSKAVSEAVTTQQGSQPPTRQVIEAVARANGGPIQANPEQNLPFGALSILSRPKATAAVTSAGIMPPFKSLDGVSSYSKERPVRSTSHNPTALLRELAQPTTRVPDASHGYTSFQAPAPSSLPVPAMLQRQRDANAEQQLKLLSLFGKQQAASPPAALGAGHANPTQTQNLLSLLKQPPFSSASAAPNSSGAKPEQKEKLLSLFGKQQSISPPAAPATADKGKGKATEASLLEQISGGGQTAQINPLVAAGAPGMARATAAGGVGVAQSSGSAQTPISPADRSFLLGYLQSASSVTR